MKVSAWNLTARISQGEMSILRLHFHRSLSPLKINSGAPSESAALIN
jgi:hypothetical protein